ncbi:prepilin peptidase [Janthinobacterium sp.]|uniref:A24 family peptidase n=1 Tax=Janthinobacterium sp. TaxID=1871054 RepID=UPI0028988C4E|nr:prepilin peptidase [Janthinobacterium sp.]
MYAHPVVTWLPSLLLAGLMAGAVWHDVRSRKIPNRLVFPGALVGVLLNALLPAAGTAFMPVPGGLGMLTALVGLGLGLLLLLPMYALKTMGAGDVKLMAMIGAFVGPQAVFGCMLFSLLAGGVLALGVAAYHGTLRQMTSNSYHLLLSSLMRGIAGQRPEVDAPKAPSGKLPYAIAIAAGTLIYLLLVASGRFALFA